MDELETRAGSEVTVFKPTSKEKQSKGKSVIEHLQRLKDWLPLGEVVDAHLDDQEEHIHWWDERVRPAGSQSNISDQKYLSADDAEDLTGISRVQVSRWRKKLKDRMAYKGEICGAAWRKANGVPADGELLLQSLSNEHYTPQQYIEAARRVMGGIDLDPATCLPANETVKAANIFTSADDGLKQPWHGRIWLNPPYGRMAGDFIAKLMAEFATGNAKDAIVLVNAHCTDTSWFQALWNGELCFTDHRINFYGDDARSGSTHGSVFAYFGPSTELFVSEFKVFGPIVRRISDDYSEPRSV